MELLKLTSTWASTRCTRPVGHQLVNSGVHVFNTGVGDDDWRPLQVFPSLLQDVTRRDGIEPSCETPRQDAAREVVDDGVEVRLRVIDKSDDGHVDMPVLVGVRCPNARLGLCGIHTATRSPPITLPDELGPGCRRREDLAGSLRKEGQSSKWHVPIVGSGDHLLDGAYLGGVSCVG
jgi:hypothetical protein